MIEKELPIYVDNFKIFDLDTSSMERKYRLVSETCDIEISENVKKLLDFIKLNEGEFRSFIVDKFCLNDNSTKESVEKTISLLFEKGVLSNEKKEQKELIKEDYYRNKMEHLWFRIRLIDTEKHEKFFKFFSFVFSKPFVVFIISLFIIFDIIFIISYYFTTWSKQLIYYSTLDYFYVGFVYGYITLFLHEIGHITAAKRYNAETGGIGVGIYYYFFVGYADVHETWNLPRKERRVISIAGFYWNIISILPLFILSFYFKSKAVADIIILFHLLFIRVFSPFLKMDGYWFLCDILGVPSLKTRISIYLFQYLPSKLLRKVNITNPFCTYPQNVRKGVIIYLIIFLFFICIFLPLFFSMAINIALNIEEEIFSPAKLIIENWHSSLNGLTTYINKLIRNIFILFGAIMFLITYMGRFIKFIFNKIH